MVEWALESQQLLSKRLVLLLCPSTFFGTGHLGLQHAIIVLSPEHMHVYLAPCFIQIYNLFVKGLVDLESVHMDLHTNHTRKPHSLNH